MPTLRSALRAAAASFLCVLATSSVSPNAARAQDILDIGFLPYSLWDLGSVRFRDLNRPVLGSRQAALGGAGIALSGDLSSIPTNPAGIAAMRSVSVYSELRAKTGSGSNFEAPPELVVDIPGVGPQTFELTNYASKPTTSFSYDMVGIATPIQIGSRVYGVGGLSYRRFLDPKGSQETRFNLQGDITQGAIAGLGTSDEVDGGADALCVTLASDFFRSIRVGLNLNFLQGDFENHVETGVSVFGFRVSEAVFNSRQEITGFFSDLGAQIDLLDSRVTLGGVLNFPGDMHFDSGRFELLPITPPDPSLPRPPRIIGTLSEYTLRIPTQFGFGVAARPVERILIAGDYWLRPWGDAEIIQPGVVFNPATSSFDRTGINVYKSAELEDTNSFRVGLEYTLVDKAGLTLPLRIGYRQDDQTYPSYDPADLTDTDGDGPFHGERVSGSTLSIGAGIAVRQVTAGFSVERSSYDIVRPLTFFPSIPPIPSNDVAEETIGNTRLVFSTSFTF